MRGFSPYRHCGNCLLVYVVGMRTDPCTSIAGSSSSEEPWLAERMLDIPVALSSVNDSGPDSAKTDGQPLTAFTLRFDALLIDPDGVASHILREAAIALNSLNETNETNPGGDWGGWGVEGFRAIAVSVREVLAGAAESVYRQIGEDLIFAVSKGIDGDWLEAADATCKSLVLQRRHEISQVYQYGRRFNPGAACSQPVKRDGGKITCGHAAPDNVMAANGFEVGWGEGSAASLAACRVFFHELEMEYAKAACLRAAHLGDLSVDDSVEVDMRLAAIAFSHGRPSEGVRLYFRILSRPSTTNDERLAVSILGLTTVSPTLIGSPQMMAKFRANWTRDLGVLRRNLISGVTKGRLWDPHYQVGITPFHLAHQGGPDLELMASLAGVYDAAAPSLRYTAHHCRNRPGGEGDSRWKLEGRPTRIGFFSSYLRHHSVGKMMALLIAGLSEDSRLEVHLFEPTSDSSSGGGETKRSAAGDPVVDFLRSTVRHWHQVPPKLDAARRAVASEKLDVLVYPDLGMEPLTYFMAFARLALVQCVWWGHPVTPSTGAIDYFLSLEVELDEGQADYMEQMVRMDVINTAPFQQMSASSTNSEPRSEQYDDSGASSLPSASMTYGVDTKTSDTATERLSVQPPAAEAAAEAAAVAVAAVAAGVKRATAAVVSEEPDLSDSDISCHRIYLVLGRLFKLHPAFDAAISGVLAGDPVGCVVLLHEKRDEEWTRAVWSRLRGPLLSLGLFDRLRIVHYWRYPEVLRSSSVVLDTFPYGGCLTVLEGLSNGVPVVTFPSDFVRGRFALAMYRQMEFTDLVADSVEEYISLALKLANEEAFRKEALARVEEGYRVSLHRNERSAEEWGAFFRRALRAAAFDISRPQER